LEWATQWEADRSLESYVLNLGVENILSKGEKIIPYFSIQFNERGLIE
jgi:hypothetical protein